MRPAAFYFLFVFGAGFVLGPIRQLWLVPRVGVRAAELMEIPLMLAVIVYAAKWLERRFPAHPALRTGLVALTLLLAAEIGLGVLFTGRSVRRVLFDRDPVSGTAYYAALAVFAAMPAVLRASGRESRAGGTGSPNAVKR